MLRLRALDGYELGAFFYGAPGGRAPRRVAVLHGGAGIAAARYRYFAAFLAQSGVPVLSYDYRGVGLSRPPSLRGFRASMEDWAEYDCGGAVAWLRERFPHAEMVGIAHSIGTLLLGGAGNASEQARLVMIGPHTGYYGDYRLRYRAPMTAVWHGLMPAVARLAGYFPAHRLGLGEDLPREIALQWAARLSSNLRPSGEGAGHERMHRLLGRCAALQRPALLTSISDDAFATSAGVRRLLSCYPGLQQRHLVFTPADAGISRIGHFGFFAPSVGAALWPRLLEQIGAESAPSA
jgi:predicted alpha/beta hydrolase